MERKTPFFNQEINEDIVSASEDGNIENAKNIPTKTIVNNRPPIKMANQYSIDRERILPYEYIIVGAGFYGLMIAFFLSRLDKKVLIIDRNFDNNASLCSGAWIYPFEVPFHLLLMKLCPHLKAYYTIVNRNDCFVSDLRSVCGPQAVVEYRVRNLLNNNVNCKVFSVEAHKSFILCDSRGLIPEMRNQLEASQNVLFLVGDYKSYNMRTIATVYMLFEFERRR